MRGDRRKLQGGDEVSKLNAGAFHAYHAPF